LLDELEEIELEVIAEALAWEFEIGTLFLLNNAFEPTRSIPRPIRPVINSAVRMGDSFFMLNSLEDIVLIRYSDTFQ
jgi:hypothetical protein